MNLTRIILSLGLVSSILGECTKPKVRREIRELSQNERNKLFAAIVKLMEPDPFSKDKLSRFEKFARIHQNANKFAHGRPAFYPWHRVFLRYFEMELQRIDPEVQLAYWDWSYDSEHPEKSEIFDYIGKNGDPDDNYKLKTGPFNNTLFHYPSKHYLTRKFDEGGESDDSISSFASPEKILVSINEKRFSFFAHLMERFHGDPHMSVGDKPSDFSTMYSPLDPIFYFHHTFVDLVWWQWQKKHPNVDQYEGIRYRQKNVQHTERMIPFALKAQDAFDTTSDFFCYTYPEYPTKFASKDKKGRTMKLPAAFSNPLTSTFEGLDMEDIINKVEQVTQGRTLDPFNKEKVKKLKPIKRRWILDEGMDEESIRDDEIKVDKFTDALNKMPFFQPLARKFD